MTASLPVRNSAVLDSLYDGKLPPLESVRLRSLHLNWRGPSITLRLDLPLPAPPLPDPWDAEGINAVQCQLQFLAVNGLALQEWAPPLICNFSITKPDLEHRIKVTASKGEQPFLHFTSNADVLVGHLSAFELGMNGEDDGSHAFLSKLDRKRHSSLPDPCEKTFYERI